MSSITRARTIGLAAPHKPGVCPDAAKTQDRRYLGGETLIRVVAAATDELPCAGVERDGLAEVENLVAGLDQQQVAFGPRDGADRKRAQFVEMAIGDLERGARVQVGLHAAIRRQVDVRLHRRVDQHGAGAELLGGVRGVVATERAATKVSACLSTPRPSARI